MDPKYLQQLYQSVAYREVSNTQVSQWNIGWHIEHCLHVINKSLDAVLASNPANYKPKFSIWGLIIMNTGYIPRGRARSPKLVAPQGNTSEQALTLALEEAKKRLSEVPKQHPKAFFPHPIFGHLHRDKALRFLEIHTHHHLKIIKDILGKDL